jgi:HSP20 family protein
MATHGLVPRRLGRRLTPARPVFPAFGNVDSWFDDLWRGAGNSPSAVALADFVPRIDVSETDEELCITAELPGVEEKDFDISVEGDVLTLKGEKRSDHEEKGEGYHRVERSSGSFHRAFRFHFDVDSEAVEAKYANGVLTIVVRKPVEARAQVQTIPVSTS